MPENGKILTEEDQIKMKRYEASTIARKNILAIVVMLKGITSMSEQTEEEEKAAVDAAITIFNDSLTSIVDNMMLKEFSTTEVMKELNSQSINTAFDYLEARGYIMDTPRLNELKETFLNSEEIQQIIEGSSRTIKEVDKMKERGSEEEYYRSLQKPDHEELEKIKEIRQLNYLKRLKIEEEKRKSRKGRMQTIAEDYSITLRELQECTQAAIDAVKAKCGNYAEGEKGELADFRMENCLNSLILGVVEQEVPYIPYTEHYEEHHKFIDEKIVEMVDQYFVDVKKERKLAMSLLINPRVINIVRNTLDEVMDLVGGCGEE